MSMRTISLAVISVFLAGAAAASSRDDLYDVCVSVSEVDGMETPVAKVFCTCLADGAVVSGQSTVDELQASGNEPDKDTRIASLGEDAKSVVEKCMPPVHE